MLKIDIMNIENLKFAFALNKEGTFEKKHFGDSDKFAIYALTNNLLTIEQEMPNIYKEMDEEAQHGSAAKGKAIIAGLKEKGVSILVSRQFGKNIKIVNDHFIPVIIYDDDPENVSKILLKNANWLIDELNNQSVNHKPFMLKNGILKKVIKKD